MISYPNIHERVKTLEERYTLLRQLLDNLEESFVNEEKRLEDRIKNLENEINNLKKDIQDLLRKIDAIMNQLPMFATSDRVEVIEKYLDLINPFELLSKKEAYNLINRVVEDKLSEVIKKLREEIVRDIKESPRNKFKSETILIE